MITSHIITTFFGIFGSVLSAIILATIKYGQAKSKRREEEHQKMHKLTLGVLKSELDMNEVMCRCIANEAHNGDLEKAKSSVAESKKNLENYLTEKASENI